MIDVNHVRARIERMLITDFDLQKAYIVLYIQVQTVKRKRSKIGSAAEVPVKHGNQIWGN